MIVVSHQLSNFSAISWREHIHFQEDDDEVHFALDQQLDFFSATCNSLKQQSVVRHVAPLPRRIIPILLSREATNVNFMVFGLTRLGLEPTIYHTRGDLVHALLTVNK